MKQALNEAPARSSGAGYIVNKHAWKEAAEEGLEKKILERLKIFGRPVSVSALSERLSTGSIPYTEQEIKERLNKLKETGKINQLGKYFELKLKED